MIFLSYVFEHCILIISAMIIILIIIVVLVRLTYSEKKYRSLAKELHYIKSLIHVFGSNIDNVFCVYNKLQKKFEYVSPNLEKILEIDSEILIEGKNKILEYMPEDMRDKIKNMFRNAGNTGMSELDFEYIKPISKNKCWIIIRVYPVYHQNKLIRYITTTTDITKEKLYQKALEDALYNTNKANESKKSFLSHMSHELKTPINAILGMTKIASISLDDKVKTENCLNKINLSSKKLLTLIKNILDAAKIDSDKLILVKEPFQLSEVLSSFSSIMNTQAELSYQEYTFQLNNIQDDFLIGDSLRLIQILENCISNSIKFTSAGGKINFKVSEEERHADQAHYRFIISDTGRGMCEEFLQHLFLPFEQEDDSISQKYGGTGIGMTIAKELVDLMGGNITVTSKVNVGTTYTIDISFYINENPPKQEETKDIETVLYDLKGKRALVVEDNEINLEIICEGLTYMNMKVETTTNGSMALQLFEASEKGYYDVVLMDIQMPILDGYETTKSIRASSHPDSKTICIIALTADDFSDNQLSLGCGMNYHITKPIDIHCFYNILQNEFFKEKSGTNSIPAGPEIRY